MAETALVTGASSGIGTVFAKQLAQAGYGLILVARRVERLEALATELREKHGVTVTVLPADLARPEAIEKLAESVSAQGLEVDLLVNNAGIGHHGPFVEAPWEPEQRMIDLNMTALTAMTHRFLPGMLARKRGGVINVASTAAFQPIPFMAVYAATKAYVLSFSEAIAEEAAPHGVKVVCLCPGPTETEFVDKAEFKTDIISKAPMMTAESVVSAALASYRRGETVSVPGVLNSLSATLPRFSPRRLTAKIAGSLFKPTH
ncbi:MAG TPA: SDR family oxidoreductase [Oscillatoriaceae cyanobacterium]